MKRILIVEDDQLFANTYGNRLRTVPPQQVIDVLRGAFASSGPPAATPPPLVKSPGPARTSQAPSHSPPAANGIAGRDVDKEFETSLRTSFVEDLPATLAVMRTLLKGLVRAETETARLKQLDELYRRIRAVTGNAVVVGLPQIARLSEPLEALLKELHEKPKTITASALRTVASAIDFLGLFFKHGRALETLETSPPKVLVVDDEAISRRAVIYALEKAKLKSVNVEDPNVAYDLLTKTKFDLIFLDVDMPGMNGFELCSKLRQLPGHEKTPVVFVTGLTDFESRANSTVSGGTDFIAKPFQFIELAVKALVCILRGRLPSMM